MEQGQREEERRGHKALQGFAPGFQGSRFMSVGFLEVYNPDYIYRAPGGWACGAPGGCGGRTSCEGALHVVDDLVVVTDDVVTVDDDRHLLAQVEPHEPGLLVLTLRQAHVPLVTGQALLRDHQPHLQAPGSERGRRADTRGHSAQVGWSIWGREVRGHIREGTLLLLTHSWVAG